MRDRKRSSRHLAMILVGLCSMCSMCIGCLDGSSKRAEAVLRVYRERFDGPTDEFLIYQKTQASLIKSEFVINRALDVNVLADLDVKQLSKELRVHVTETELISVILPVGRRTMKRTEQILNAVVDSYVKEIVFKERMEKTEELTKLRRRYQELYDEIIKKTDEITTLSRRTGALDSKAVQTHREIGKLKLSNLHAQLVRVKLQQIDEAARKTRAGANRSSLQSTILKKITFLEKQIEDQTAELAEDRSMSGDLKLRQFVLDDMRKNIGSLQEKMQKLDVEMDGPQRVAIVQRAVAN